MKNCKIIAGPNGSGKSAFFAYTRISHIIDFDDCPYLCGDDIATQLKKEQLNLDEDALNREAQQIVFNKRQEFMERGISFVYETVCSHPSHLTFFQALKEHGYTLSLVYNATEDVEINVSRVARRVKEGGHNVPLEKIKARYNRCLELYPKLLNLCDNAFVFDNSTTFELCLSKENGRIEIHNQSHHWALKHI